MICRKNLYDDLSVRRVRRLILYRTAGSFHRSEVTPGEPWTCDSPGELQRRLQEMDEIQRQDYPSIAGRSRGEAFPQLSRWTN